MRYTWRPYVSVARRRRNAVRQTDKLRKKGVEILPIEIEGRRIAETFWGQAWCRHIESFSDYANRLPRGRTYVRNGSVCHLDIAKAKVKAIVSGSELYNVTIKIAPLAARKWRRVKRRCAGQIGSLLELLQGRLSKSVMAVVTDRRDGLFPLPKEISLDCDCPDWAVMCKHVAAVLYGVGARLDEKPELLFLLRGVDYEELISAEAEAAAASVVRRGGSGRRIAAEDISGVFGIDIAPEAPRRKKAPTRKSAKKATLTVAAKETRTGKVAKKATAKMRKASSRQVIRKAKKKAAKKHSQKGPTGTTAGKPSARRAKSDKRKTPDKSAKSVVDKANRTSR